MTITATHWGVVDARIEEGRLNLNSRRLTLKSARRGRDPQ